MNNSDTHLVTTPGAGSKGGGLVLTRSIRRLSEKDCWNKILLQNVIGHPWEYPCYLGGHLGFGRPKRQPHAEQQANADKVEQSAVPILPDDTLLTELVDPSGALGVGEGLLPAPDRVQDKENATDGVGVRVPDEDSITSSSVSVGDAQDIPAEPASSVPTKRSIELPASARSAGQTSEREQKQMRMSPAKSQKLSASPVFAGDVTQPHAEQTEGSDDEVAGDVDAERGFILVI